MAVRLPIGIVEQADEHLDRAVVVDGAEDVVEVHGAIEKSPADVAHQGAQECVDRHDVAVAGTEDVGEIFVALELEFADRERFVAKRVGGSCAGFVGVVTVGACAVLIGNHPYTGLLYLACVWQISAQRSMVKSPLMVCCRRTPGLALRNW